MSLHWIPGGIIVLGVRAKGCHWLSYAEGRQKHPGNVRTKAVVLEVPVPRSGRSSATIMCCQNQSSEQCSRNLSLSPKEVKFLQPRATTVIEVKVKMDLPWQIHLIRIH
ncbi:hypothetical protein B296_00018991 [Ensete ventricosum]|uniref:Uncharacterized protein n=1 Tax=Ensete ventricosum TaxID=4639 RepID=A0A426ZAG1_ENSVE|nr:hypothetical protein B296_00018991 [Ensete ventricosum]